MDTGRATEGPEDVLDSTSRSPTERNAVDMPGFAAAVESWREMRARPSILDLRPATCDSFSEQSPKSLIGLSLHSESIMILLPLQAKMSIMSPDNK